MKSLVFSLLVCLAMLAGNPRLVLSAEPVVIDEAPERLRDIKPRLWSVAFSADGKTLAVTGGWDQPEEPGELVVWDLESRSQKLVKRQEKTIRRAVFSPNGKLPGDL